MAEWPANGVTDWNTKGRAFIDVEHNGATGKHNGPSVATGWVNFDGRGTNGACTVNSSFNVSGVARTGTGTYAITWSVALSGGNYVISGTTTGTSGGIPAVIEPGTISAASLTIDTKLTTTGAADDLSGRKITVTVFGP